MHDHVQRDAAERACANLEAGSALKRRWNTKHNRTRIHRSERTRVLLHVHYTRVYTIVNSKKQKTWMRSFSYTRTHAHICKRLLCTPWREIHLVKPETVKAGWLPFLVKPLSPTAEIPGSGCEGKRPERNARVFVAASCACTKTVRAMCPRVSAICVSRRVCTASIGHR